jgi:hypothetical protein
MTNVLEVLTKINADIERLNQRTSAIETVTSPLSKNFVLHRGRFCRSVARLSSKRLAARLGQGSSA